MSASEQFMESEPDALSSSISADEPQASSGSDGEVESYGSETRRRLNTVEAVLTKGVARHHGEKRPSQATPSRHIHDERGRKRKGASSSTTATASPRPSPGPPLGVEVMSALKDITSLLNSVVERVERVENEVHRQKYTGPCTSSDSTPTRAKLKPPLVVKVSQNASVYVCVQLWLAIFVLQSEVRRVYRDLLESDDHTFAGFDLETGYVRC